MKLNLMVEYTETEVEVRVMNIDAVAEKAAQYLPTAQFEREMDELALLLERSL